MVKRAKETGLYGCNTYVYVVSQVPQWGPSLFQDPVFAEHLLLCEFVNVK